jgi:hypothetical protein
MKLINLKPARVSLEFAAEEWPRVSVRLQRFGIVSRIQFATHDNLRVGSENFVFSDDGDELALISQSAAGDLMLKRVLHNLGVGFSASGLRNSFRARRQGSSRSAKRAA